nr:group II intron reverse transcriptase/maturase [Pigmentibacter ruber]
MRETMVVHSIGEQTWLTKLKRIGELSASNKDIVFNNLGYIINIEMLWEMFNKLDGSKAVGIDCVTKEKYRVNLQANLRNLLSKIRNGKYAPKPSRITEIPKEDGSTRPLAIACLEDKIVQMAVSKLLTQIYDPLFLNTSFGFRENRNCHMALKELARQTFYNQHGAIVELDIRKYFNEIPHENLETFLRMKISDNKFIKLIMTLARAPIMKDGNVNENTIGCPQGSIVSPILANIYLHHVIDKWFQEISQTHLKGRCEMVRYADDMVFTFQSMLEAKRFFEVLPKRLSKFGLRIHLDKSQIIPAGNVLAQRARTKGRKLPSFNFLGFTCYWAKAATKNYWRINFTSRKDRFSAKLKGLRKYLLENSNTKDITAVFGRIISVIRGWINYHAVTDNHRRVSGFIYFSKRIIYKWFKLRGSQKGMTWVKLISFLERIGFSSSWKTTSLLPSLK